MFSLRRIGLALGGLAAVDLGYYSYLRSTETRHPFNSYTTAEEAVNGVKLDGKTAIVTGSNTGIGKETARVLTKQGCNVIMACRSQKRGDDARNDILNDLGLSSDYDKLSVMILDLGSLDSVKTFANQFNSKNVKIDYLINNAGIARHMSNYTTTQDGFEASWGINHLGHFYLTNLLMPSLFLESDSAQVPRVINLASTAEHMTEKSYNYFMDMIDTGLKELKFYPDKFINDEFYGTDAYSFSKSCNILFTKELVKKYESDKLICVSVQPGGVLGTELVRDSKGANSDRKRNFFKWVVKGGVFSQKFYIQEIKDVPQGAATTIRCVVLKDNEISNGSFYHNCRAQDANVIGIASDKQDTNGQMAEKMWQLSKSLLETKGHSVGNV